MAGCAAVLFVRNLDSHEWYRGAQSVCQKSGMDIKKQLTRKLIQATSDKVELNKQAFKWKKSMEEAAKALGGGKKKPS